MESIIDVIKNEPASAVAKIGMVYEIYRIRQNVDLLTAEIEHDFPGIGALTEKEEKLDTIGTSDVAKVGSELSDLVDSWRSLRLKYSSLGRFRIKQRKTVLSEVKAVKAHAASIKDSMKQFGDISMHEAVECYRFFEEKGACANSEGVSAAMQIALGKESIFFGRWYSDDEPIKKPIEWTVLSKEDDTALLISKYCIDCMPYNTISGDVTWELCSLREWLNGVFFENAFSSTENGVIVLSNVRNAHNAEYGTPAGGDTKDKVFLLSIDEANEYFKTQEERKAAPTKYAVSHGACVSSTCKSQNGELASWWWLRSPGLDSCYASYVRNLGDTNSKGLWADNKNSAVRPVLRIKLS